MNNDNASSFAPIVVNGWILPSIFDDSDACYHADANTGKTPAQERRRSAACTKDEALATTVPNRRHS